MSNGQEFYPGNEQQYAKDHNKNELYVTHYKRDSNNNEVYETHNGKQIYAKDKDGKPFYAKLSDQSELYAKDENNNDYYVKTKDGEVYAKNKNQEEIYGTRADGNQFYAKTKRGRSKFVKVGNKEMYAKDVNGNEMYPRNTQGKCIVAKDNNIPYYIKVNDDFIYPTDENNNQYIVNGKYISDYDGKVVLPLNNLGLPMYEKDKYGNELYKYDGSGYPIFGKNYLGKEVYAKRNNMNEYYPTYKGTVVFAEDNKYALSNIDSIIYPEENGEQFYIEGGNEMLKKHAFHYIIGKYPKDEFNRETLIFNFYAQDALGNLIYPKDEYKNEYIRNPDLKHQPIFINDNYPVTNDGYIIIPNYLNKPLYCVANKDVTEKNIVKLLFRSNAPYDFLTNIKTTKKKSSQIPYETLSLSSPIYLNRIFQYVVGVLIFIIFILLILKN